MVTPRGNRGARAGGRLDYPSGMGLSGWSLVAIAVGSAAGGVLRHLLTEAMLRFAGPGFPWGTLVVNVTGSLAVGVCSTLVAVGWPVAWGPVGRLGLVTGVLGGFTTFSAFAVQTTGLVATQRTTQAVGYVAASVGLGLAACWLGAWAAERVVR